MSETHAEPRSDNGRWLYARRLKIALGIAVLEGIFVAFAKDFSQWTVIIISIPIIGFYIFAVALAAHRPCVLSELRSRNPAGNREVDRGRNCRAISNLSFRAK